MILIYLISIPLAFLIIKYNQQVIDSNELPSSPIGEILAFVPIINTMSFIACLMLLGLSVTFCPRLRK